jgi:hypothetical protein
MDRGELWRDAWNVTNGNPCGDKGCRSPHVLELAVNQRFPGTEVC